MQASKDGQGPQQLDAPVKGKALPVGASCESVVSQGSGLQA